MNEFLKVAYIEFEGTVHFFSPISALNFYRKNSNYLSLWLVGVPGTPGITQELTSLLFMENSGFDCSEVKENFQDWNQATLEDWNVWKCRGSIGK